MLGLPLQCTHYSRDFVISLFLCSNKFKQLFLVSSFVHTSVDTPPPRHVISMSIIVLYPV